MVSTKIAMKIQFPSKQTKQHRGEVKAEKRGKRGTAEKVVFPWLEYVSAAEPGMKLHV